MDRSINRISASFGSDTSLIELVMGKARSVRTQAPGARFKRFVGQKVMTQFIGQAGIAMKRDTVVFSIGDGAAAGCQARLEDGCLGALVIPPIADRMTTQLVRIPAAPIGSPYEMSIADGRIEELMLKSSDLDYLQAGSSIDFELAIQSSEVGSNSDVRIERNTNQVEAFQNLQGNFVQEQSIRPKRYLIGYGCLPGDGGKFMQHRMQEWFATQKP